MNNIGLLFPGQGSQYIGMGKDIYNEIKEAKELMDKANEILGFDIKKIIFDGEEEELVKTQIAQIAIYIVSAMYLEKFKQMGKPFEIVAGHSLGEYSALYAGGAFSYEEGLKLVRARGLAMSQGNNLGTMFAVMGIPLREIINHIEKYEGKVVIANINSKTQIVISGYTKETKEAAEKLSQIEDSTIKELKVSSAFHSPLMMDAMKKMEKEISLVSFKEPDVEIIPNVLGYGTKEVVKIKNALISQITGQVKWLDTIMYIKDRGIKELYEIGPGDVLTKLNKTITFRPKCMGL